MEEYYENLINTIQKSLDKDDYKLDRGYVIIKIEDQDLFSSYGYNTHPNIRYIMKNKFPFYQFKGLGSNKRNRHLYIQFQIVV